MSVEIKGLDEVQKMLGKLQGPEMQRAAQMAGKMIGEEGKGIIATYPGPPSHPINWASVAQRKAYFAQRHKAGLPPRYTRGSDPMSQRLGASWAVKAKGWGAVLGTKVSYAPFVQSKVKQQPMHKATGWITDEETVRRLEQGGKIKKIVSDAIRKVIGI